MSLRGICPCCYAVVSLDALVSDDDARALIALVAELPPAVGRAYVRYLGLFRHSTRAVSWSKLRRLTEELVPLIRAEQVRRDGRTLPAPHALWAEALDDLVGRRGRPGFRLPLSTHGYLLEMVVGLADPLAEAEAKATEAARLQQESVLRRARRPVAVDDAPRAPPADFAALAERLGLGERG